MDQDTESEDRESSDYDSEKEACRLLPPKKKKKAMTGAATYRTKFKDLWKKVSVHIIRVWRSASL